MSIKHLSASGTLAGPIQDSPGIGMDGFFINGILPPKSPHFAVTAVETGKGHLRLIGWNVGLDGKITRVGDSGDQAGPVSLVALTQIAGQSVTAVRTVLGKLKLIQWSFDLTAGKFFRGIDSDDREGAVSVIRISHGGNGFLVAVRNAAGNLELQNWHFDLKDKPLVMFNMSDPPDPAGAISHLALGSVLGMVYTAVRGSSSGNLKVIIWKPQADGKVKRLGDSKEQGGPIRLVDAVAFGALIVTAVRDKDGMLKLISWQVSDDGMTVTKLADSGNPAGGTDMLACIAVGPFWEKGLFDSPDPHAMAGRVFTAMRTKEKTLKIIEWKVTLDGAIARGEERERQGAVDAVAFSNYSYEGNVYISAVRDAGDKHLRLDVWQFNP